MKTYSLSYTAFFTSLCTHLPRSSNTEHLSCFKSDPTLEPPSQAVLFSHACSQDSNCLTW